VKKKLENKIKTITYSKKQVSAVDARSYGNRFTEYMNSITVGIEGVRRAVQRARYAS